METLMTLQSFTEACFLKPLIILEQREPGLEKDQQDQDQEAEDQSQDQDLEVEDQSLDQGAGDPSLEEERPDQDQGEEEPGQDQDTEDQDPEAEEVEADLMEEGPDQDQDTEGEDQSQEEEDLNHRLSKDQSPNPRRRIGVRRQITVDLQCHHSCFTLLTDCFLVRLEDQTV